MVRVHAWALALIDEALRSNDPWLRLGGTRALSSAPLEVRSAHLLPLADDPVRGVRLELAPLLAEVRADALPEGSRLGLRSLFSEHREWLAANGDRAGAMVSLANLERSAGDGPRAEGLLRRALVLHPDAADVHFALGLMLVRTRAWSDATRSLARAAQLAPDDGHYAYVHAVALHSTGEVAHALDVLGDAEERFPESVEIRSALRAYCAEASAAGRGCPRSSVGARGARRP